MAPEVVGSNPIFHPQEQPDDESHPVFLFPMQRCKLACISGRGNKKRCASAHQVAHERAPAASGNGTAQPARASTIPSDSNDDGKPDYT